MSARSHAPDEGAELDVSKLEAYLSGHLAEFGGPLSLERFAGGQSNPTFKLVTAKRNYVMRCKPGPVAKLLPSAHAIEREFRVQAALLGSEVPVPQMCCLCEDETIIGRSFYIMEYVAGRIWWDPGLPGCSRNERAAIYDEMNRIIAALHGIDPAAVGLDDYGKPGDYFARQIDRWSRRYRATETEPIEAMNNLIEWLPAHVPADDASPVAIVHGDFRLDNLIFHPTEPRVLAVIDWELSTLGHPLADFAYHAMIWCIPPGRIHGVAGIDPDALGIPAESEYWDRYLQRTGLRVAGHRSFYLAYNLFRIAGILQGIAKRVREGTASSAQAAEIGKAARPMAQLAWRFAQHEMGD